MQFHSSESEEGKMTIGKKELNLRLAPEKKPRKKCCFRSRPDQGRSIFFFLKERKFTGWWVLFRSLLPHIKVTGFEPMALCTQNRCADQTALHLVSPPSAYRSTRSMKTRTELAHPFGVKSGTREPIRVINRFFYKICLQQDRATPKSRIVQERSHFFLASSWSWI